MERVSIEAVIAFLGLVGAGLAAYVSIHVRIKALEIQVKQLEKAEDKQNEKFEIILDKISQMHQSFNELLIEFTKIK